MGIVHDRRFFNLDSNELNQLVATQLNATLALPIFAKAASRSRVSTRELNPET